LLRPLSRPFLIKQNTAKPIPAEIHGQRYISLATFRKTGVSVYTAIWFSEEHDKLYFMTNSKLGKVKRIRNNRKSKSLPALCVERSLALNSQPQPTSCPPKMPPAFARAINAKYWLARLPLLWRNTDTYVELTPAWAQENRTDLFFLVLLAR
jgi:hypothetical protein